MTAESIAFACERLRDAGAPEVFTTPIGMKKKYPTYIDEIATLFDRIYVSAGLRGQQLIIDPQDLLSYTEATFADLTKR